MHMFSLRFVRVVGLFLMCLLLGILLTGCSGNDTAVVSQPVPAMDPVDELPTLRAIIDPSSEVRGVYIASVYNIDFPSKTNLSADRLRDEIDSILDTMESAGLNTVYFQVRPTCDALYESKIFPVSSALSTKGKLEMDPLAYMVEQAHQRNIFVHAWVNPLRVSLGSAANPNVFDVSIL